MSQTWTDDVYASGHVAATDLANMENNFAALKSLFSGTGAPSSMAACHPWFDTTKHVLKVRDDGDSAWLGLMHGDVNHKLWVYRNSALSGWAVDSAVTDKVLAVKGGSTYTTGAATAGTCTLSGLTANHSHSHSHAITADGQHYHSSTVYAGASGDFSGSGDYRTDTDLDHDHGAATGTDATATNATVASAGTWRPAAAVGTLQYLDL